MALREFIYIDSPRVNIYVEQIADPLKRDKIPQWNASLSLTGPRCGGEFRVNSGDIRRIRKWRWP